MPWQIKQNTAGCNGYAVVKETGELVGCHPSKSKAMAHMRALYANVKDVKKVKSILRGNNVR